MLVSRNVVIDPVHGAIEIPSWLKKIIDYPAVRRMLFIRQLGLKGIIEYPGAFHNRYSHSLGVMHLANRLIDKLINKADSPDLRDVLKTNKNTVAAAAFFHDIGHGPFSHVLDYPLESICGRNHEEIAGEIISAFFREELEDEGIPHRRVISLIKGTHRYSFLNKVINGPIDVDKLDYVLRDSYYVGLNFGFDLDFFLEQYAVLGDPQVLEECDLGLENSIEAIDCAEVFLLIWKTMYDVVYFAPNARVAEKMLEKAILIAANLSNDFKQSLCEIKRFSELHDVNLLEILSNIGDFPKDVVRRIRENDLFKRVEIVGWKSLKELNLPASFVTRLSENPDALSDELSKKFCEEMGLDIYSVICDIIVSKTPKEEIHLLSPKKEEPLEIGLKSPIITTLREDRKVMVVIYLEPSKFEELRKKYGGNRRLQGRLNEIWKSIITEGA